MKNIDAFREYLTTSYVSNRTGQPLKPTVAHDVISRCRRVEKALHLELDAIFRQKGAPRRKEAPMEKLASKIKSSHEKFNYDGGNRFFYVYLITAVRHYYRFCRRSSLASVPPNSR